MVEGQLTVAVAQLKAICPRTVCIGVTGNAGHDCAEAQQLMAATGAHAIRLRDVASSRIRRSGEVSFR